MEPEAVDTEEQPPAGPTVLVVDDDPAIREMLAFALELEGYHVLLAGDGREALRVVAEEAVDLVTLDVMMPLMDGWQVADALFADKRTRALPRIMISGLPVDVLMRACAARQGSAIVSKPFDLDRVVALIERLLAESGHLRHTA